MDAEGAAGKSKAKRQWKKIDPGQILDIQSYEDQRKGSEIKGKGKGNEKGKGRGNGKGENGEGKGKGKGGKNVIREEDPVAETSPQSAERSYQPRASPKGGRRDGKGKGRRKGGFQSPQGGSGFQAEEPAPTEEARPQAPPQVAATAHMAGSQFPAVGKGAGMGAYMQPAPMGHQMPYEMVPMQMFPSPFMGGMGMPYMGYTPDMMGMGMAASLGPGLGSNQAANANSSPQRHELVAKAKTQIEYYFSVNNLVKDIHLRKNVMDTQGWVSFSGLIAFPKLAQLTRTGEHASGDPTIILDAISELPQLEMKPDNSAVRLKDNWQKWVWQASDN